MDYSAEYRKNKMPMELFLQRYQDKEKYMAYCRESAITQEMLGIKIQWCREQLPDYFTLVHGIMTVNEMPEEIWLSMYA